MTALMAYFKDKCKLYVLHIMPSKKDIGFVVAIYVAENKLDCGMSRYIKAVLYRSKSPEQLEALTKEELWGLVAYFAKSLQDDMRKLGGLHIDRTF
jgi:hypothetical protein